MKRPNTSPSKREEPTKYRVFLTFPPEHHALDLIHVVRTINLTGAEAYGRTHQDLTEQISSMKSADAVVADVTEGAPNVMMDVGVAQALGKPIILLAENSRQVPFQLQGMPVLIFGSSDWTETCTRLEARLVQAFHNPSSFTIEKVEAKQQERPHIFVSYSHNDREWVDRLLVHLKPLEREGLIDLWIDTHLRAGDLWKNEIEAALEKSTVAILMLSADFLASDFIVNNELPPLLRKAESKGTRIMPLIVKPCRFTRDRDLMHFQAVNNPTQALVLLDPGAQEAVMDRLAAEVERSLSRK